MRGNVNKPCHADTASDAGDASFPTGQPHHLTFLEQPLVDFVDRDRLSEKITLHIVHARGRQEALLIGTLNPFRHDFQP
jgi:hypothetical protein